MNKDIVRVEMRKYEKTLLQRLTRISKSFIFQESDDFQQYSLREMLSLGYSDYILNEYKLFSTDHVWSNEEKVLPIGIVKKWNEDTGVGNVKINVEPKVARALQEFSRCSHLEGRYLIIDNEDEVSFTDQPSVFGAIALGLFLSHILALYKSDSDEIKIISDRCQRFLEPEDEITVHLDLLRTAYESFNDETDWWVGDKIETNSYKSYSFTFSNKGLTVVEGGVSSCISHSSLRKRNYPSL